MLHLVLIIRNKFIAFFTTVARLWEEGSAEELFHTTIGILVLMIIIFDNGLNYDLVGSALPTKLFVHYLPPYL
jgi:hypothetical protein